MTATLERDPSIQAAAPLPRPRPAWVVAGLIVGLLAIALCTWDVIGLVAHEHVHVHRTWSSAPRALDLDISDGSVTIVGGTGPRVVVDASGGRGLSSPTDEEALQGDTLRIRSSCAVRIGFDWCKLSYRLAVPAGTIVTAHTSDGSVHSSGVTAPQQLSSGNGSVTVTSPAGALVLHSSDGSVHITAATSDRVDASSGNGSVHLGFAHPPHAVTAHSSDGSVTVGLPTSPAAYQVDAHSSNGHVTTPVRTDPTGARKITASSSNGSVTVRYGSG